MPPLAPLGTCARLKKSGELRWPREPSLRPFLIRRFGGSAPSPFLPGAARASPRCVFSIISLQPGTAFAPTHACACHACDPLRQLLGPSDPGHFCNPFEPCLWLAGPGRLEYMHPFVCITQSTTRIPCTLYTPLSGEPAAAFCQARGVDGGPPPSTCAILPVQQGQSTCQSLPRMLAHCACM